jgi:hypothetical protein
MIRSIAKWYISRAIDCNRALPAWVARRLAQDPDLKQFYDRSKLLAARLQTADAMPVYNSVSDCDFAVDLPLRIATVRSSRIATRFAAVAFGLAAIALFAISPIFDQDEESVKQVPTELAEVNSKASPKADFGDLKRVDTEQLREFIASGRASVQRLKQGTDVAIGPASETALNSDVAQLAAIANLDVDQVIQPVSDLGSSYGELLSAFDQNAESENRRLIAGGINAWQFFVHKLPQSAASLAGL